MRKLLLTSLSVLALSAGTAHAHGQFQYPTGMNSGTVINNWGQVQALQNSVVEQGRADGLLTGSYYQNNPNGPTISPKGDGQVGMGNAEYSNGVISLDGSLIGENFTAEEMAFLLGHEDAHAMQALPGQNDLYHDEIENGNEVQADSISSQILGDGGVGEAGYLNNVVGLDMLEFDYNIDEANSFNSNIIYNTPAGRLQFGCPTCNLSNYSNILQHTVYDYGGNDTVEDGQSETIPSNDYVVDGQTTNTLTNLDGQFGGDDQGFWNGLDFFDGGGSYGGIDNQNNCLSMVGGGNTNAAGGIGGDNRIGCF